jgi:hypothetical protein
LDESRGMPTSQLHADLHAFATDAAATLRAAVLAGDEVPFEVADTEGLYCYQPLVEEFLERHWDCLMRLPSAVRAQAALAARGGLGEYLQIYALEQRPGVPVAQDCLRCFAHRVFNGDPGEFELEPDRFEPAFRELHQATVQDRSELAVTALLRGIECVSGEIELAEGMLLVPLDRLEALPPDAAWREPAGPATVVALVPGGGPDALEEVMIRLRDLQTALRLYAPGIALAPLAWIRGQREAWRALPIPGAGLGDGALAIDDSQEGELRAFVELIARRRPDEGELAWVLDRFELGCERDEPLSGLTDHLLALRVLLEPEGPRSGRLAGRIAALCALPHERIEVTERIARAISLEQSVVAGVPLGADAPALAAEIEQHLRALLRDVICGHLAPELAELADSLLWEAAHPQVEPQPDPEDLVIRRAAARPAQRRDDLFSAVDGDYCAAEGEVSLLGDAP